MGDQPKCTDCKFACLFDFGYSNYTTEGTEFFCSEGRHPDGHFDEFYGDDKRLEYASQCARYEAGEPVHMDVDGEAEAELTPEQKAIYDQACAMR